MKKSNLSRRQHLKHADVMQIKRLLWQGAKQTTLAIQFNVSQPHISRIANGDIYQSVPWPDGSTNVPTGIVDFPVGNTLEQDHLGKVNQPVSLMPIDFDDVDRELDHEAHLQQEEMREHEELFDSLAAEAEATLNDDLLKTIFSIDVEAEAEKPLPSSAPRSPRIPWRQIIQRQPTHPLVILTETMAEDHAVKAQKIMEQVFAQLPARQWHNKDVLEIVHQRWDEAGVDASTYLTNFLDEDL